MKNRILFSAFCCLCFVQLFAQNTVDTLSYIVPVTNNWVFYSPNNAEIEVMSKNNADKKYDCIAKPNTPNSY